MHIALGYNWTLTSPAGYLLDALSTLGHTVTCVGTGHAERPGYDARAPVDHIVKQLPQTPDLYLWVDSPGHYFPPGIENLPIPTACYLIDVHLGTWRIAVARFFDLVFVAQKNMVEPYRHLLGHRQIYWLPLAAAPEVHRHLDLPVIYDVGFVGNLNLAHRNTPRARPIAERFHTNDFYRFYSPEEVAHIYSQSRIVFNTSISRDLNMRVFEGPACGALLLTDAGAYGLEGMFEVSREIITYGDDADLLDKIAYYLAHEAERTAIAAAGYQRTHAQHTYTHRAQIMLDTLTQPNFQQLAPMRHADAAQRFATRRIIYTHLHMLDAIFDEARAAKYNPFRRMWAALPCLARRALL